MSARKISRRDLLYFGTGALIASRFHIASAQTSFGLVDVPERALLCVHLEGGVDGLAWLPPLHDPQHDALRSAIAEPSPLVLDAHTGLHPAFAPLMPFYRQGSLLALTSVGHFAQRDSSHLGAAQRLEHALYALSIDVSRRDAKAPSFGAPSGDALLSDVFSQLAAEIGKRRGHVLAHVRVPGFDTHAAQSPRLAQAFGLLGRELAALVAQLGSSFARTVVLVVSEQGRALRENRMAGTNDGLAGAALLLGGAVDGGRVDAPWPPLTSLVTRAEHSLPVRTDSAALLRALGTALFTSEPLDPDGGLLRAGSLQHA